MNSSSVIRSLIQVEAAWVSLSHGTKRRFSVEAMLYELASGIDGSTLFPIQTPELGVSLLANSLVPAD